MAWEGEQTMTLLFIYLVIAIGVSFMCSILEAVLLSITPSFAEQTIADRPRQGAKLAQVRDKLDESLSSILILNTFAHTMGAAGGGLTSAADFWCTVGVTDCRGVNLGDLVFF